MTEEERGHSKTLVYQYLPSRYGMNPDDLRRADAIEIVVGQGKASASYIQRRLKVGYNRAARMIEKMEEQGIVSHAEAGKPREVIVSHLDQL
mgnify:CR=1 FL=1